jgi:hypothetical protein
MKIGDRHQWRNLLLALLSVRIANYKLPFALI